MKPMLLAPLILSLAAADAPPSARWDWSTADLRSIGGDGEYRTSRALCAAVIHADPPAADLPTAAETAALKNCDSEALYYGIGRRADPVKARKCAFVEAASFDAQGIDRYSPFAGRAMLSVIYANGVGAARSFDVATHLACGLADAAAETDGRIKRLARLKKQRSAGRNFNMCEDATSGFLAGQCVAHEKRFADIERARRWTALTSQWPASRRADLKRLDTLLDRYVDAHGDGEVDLSGTLRTAIYIGETDALRDSHYALIKALASGRIKPASKQAYREADLRLNRAYRSLMANNDEWRWTGGSPSKDGYRAAERAWIQYRDAMLAFSAKHFPSSSGDGLAVVLIDERTHILTVD